MDLLYVLISSVMSLSIAAIICVPISRAKKSSAIFSTALGIIIFRCVKSIFAECGWGFAAIFGVFNGIAAQVTVFAASFVFLRELGEDEALRKFRFNLPQLITLLCFGAGKNLLCNYSELSDVMVYILGEAADFSLIMLSINVASENFYEKSYATVIGQSAFVITARAAIIIICRKFGSDMGNFVPLVALTMGMAGLVCEFAYTVKNGREVLAGGFAAGLTIAFCFDSLMD